MTTAEQRLRARTLRELHSDHAVLVLPNVWNPIGARVLASKGYPAVATASAAISALGFEDGEKIGRQTMLEIAAGIGEGSIDFDIRLTDVDQSNGVARLLVRHVVPEAPAIRIPATWMRAPVADTANNWVQVRREGGRYVAAVGKETFDVELIVDLASGRIVRAAMDNPVETVVRDCADIGLTECGEPGRRRILRRVELLPSD